MNVHWPVFKQIEAETVKLTYDVHICDDQLDVYSSRITDLILRCAAEIEALSKALFLSHSGSTQQTHKIHFDHDAIEYLTEQWAIHEKIVLISHHNCFQSKREICPFVKDEERTSNGKQTFGWNNAYQNLKHDRAGSLKFGSLKYLFAILAATYLLNLYYKDETLELGENASGLVPSAPFGSEIFAVAVAQVGGFDGDGNFHKPDDFIRSTYFAVPTSKTIERHIAHMREFSTTVNKLVMQRPEIISFFQANMDKLRDLKRGWEMEVLGIEEYQKLTQAALNQIPHHGKVLAFEYEAVLNKNQI